MLQKMREQKDSLFIAILFGIIIIVFVFMFGLPGANSCASKQQSDMGRAGSHNITSDLTRSMIYRHYDDNVFSSVNYASTARQVAYGIGVVYLLADEARKAGLRVSDDELTYYIKDWEAGNPDVFQLGFMQHNKFDRRSYENGLSRIMISSRDYENYKREELLARRYLTMMASSIHVSEESLWQDYKKANTEANIEIVKLTPDDVSATLVPVTADEILAYVTDHADDVKAYYDGHLGEFTTPAKAKIQQIRIQKDMSMLTNPGLKTVKTYQASQRFAIARAQIMENGADFEAAFADYDESLSKDNKGVYDLRPVSSYSFAIQDALKDKKVGDVITAEESDVFVIAKVLEQADQVVTPLEEAKFGIAAKLLEDGRVKAKTEEVAARIIELVKSGKSMQEALDEALYTGVADVAPVAVATDSDDADSADAADDSAESAADDAGADDAAADDAVAAVPVVLPADRIKAKLLESVGTATTTITGVGTDDNFARDVRNAASGTLLEKPYLVGANTVIARVVTQNEPKREFFDLQKKVMLEKAISEKSLQLVGDPSNVINLTGPYGLWVQQKIEQAIQHKQFSLNEDYFSREARKRAAKANEQQ